MSVWTEYSQQTPKGAAGSLYDLTSHVVDSFMNEENDGVMGYGVGVVVGTTPGTSCKLPATGATADKFLGIVMNGGTNEMNMNGVVNIPKGYHLSVMRQGRVWAKLADEQTPAYGGARVPGHQRDRRRLSEDRRRRLQHHPDPRPLPRREDRGEPGGNRAVPVQPRRLWWWRRRRFFPGRPERR